MSDLGVSSELPLPFFSLTGGLRFRVYRGVGAWGFTALGFFSSQVCNGFGVHGSIFQVSPILTPIMAGELSRRPAFESFEFRVQGLGFLHGFWV